MSRWSNKPIGKSERAIVMPPPAMGGSTETFSHRRPPVEAGFARGLCLVHLDTFYFRAGRTAHAGLSEQFDLFRLTGDQHFDRSVRAIADPAVEAELLCLLDGVVAITHRWTKPSMRNLSEVVS